MPLLKPTTSEKFTPKTAKLSKLFSHNTEGKSFGPSIISQTKRALKQSGFSKADIDKIVNKDLPLPIGQLKEVAQALNQNKVFGFERDPQNAIKDYLNKQRVKAQSIARINKEHILEAAEEDYSKYGVTTLNQRGVSPNAPKPGESSILARRRNTRAVSSLSGAGPTKTISSFGDQTKSGSLAKAPGTGGISPRPKF